jgi:putative flavoprotein involved in K+ transport
VAPLSFGTLRGVTGDRMHMADDAEAILSAADAMCDDTVRAISAHAVDQGLELPSPENTSVARVRSHPTSLSFTETGITSVIWSTGYSFDYGWLHAPCLDGAGQPLQQRGVGQLPGLYFLGLHWMHTFKSEPSSASLTTPPTSSNTW